MQTSPVKCSVGDISLLQPVLWAATGKWLDAHAGTPLPLLLCALR